LEIVTTNRLDSDTVGNTSIAHQVTRKLDESSHKATNNCAFANFWQQTICALANFWQQTKCAFANFWQQTNCVFANFWPLFLQQSRLLHAAHFTSNSFTSREMRIIIYM